MLDFNYTNNDHNIEIMYTRLTKNYNKNKNSIPQKENIVCFSGNSYQLRQETKHRRQKVFFFFSFDSCSMLT